MPLSPVHSLSPVAQRTSHHPRLTSTISKHRFDGQGERGGLGKYILDRQSARLSYWIESKRRLQS